MEFRFTQEDETFRNELRQFIADNWEPPPHINEAYNRPAFEAGRAYEKQLAKRGWLTRAWPKEYGGLAAPHMQQAIFREESAYAGAPGANSQGIYLIGPCIMVTGTEEQKKEYLPSIASGEVVWCQGFSEPGAGSDLASLQTRAVRDGDEYVINGQKIWTSNAHHSDWIHVLCRTDPDAPKHRGITYFLVDMKTPGIEVRPLINMLGEHGFNETYFTDVRVPVSHIVGEVNRGWYAAATTLDFERSGVTWSANGRRSLERLTQWCKETRQGANGATIWDDAHVRTKIAELSIEIGVSRLLSYRVAWMQSQGLIPNHEASVSKMFGAELSQRIANAGTRILGLYGQRVDPLDPGAPIQAQFARSYMQTVPSTIAAGSSEIQRNIIATRGLGLPRG